MASASALEENRVLTQGRNLLDIDEMVLYNANLIRSLIFSGETAENNWIPVKLKDLYQILKFGPGISIETVKIRRKDPPKGAYECLDELRP